MSTNLPVCPELRQLRLLEMGRLRWTGPRVGGVDPDHPAPLLDQCRRVIDPDGTLPSGQREPRAASYLAALAFGWRADLVEAARYRAAAAELEMAAARGLGRITMTESATAGVR